MQKRSCKSKEDGAIHVNQNEKLIHIKLDI
jgi:hypothetical protein